MIYSAFLLAPVLVAAALWDVRTRKIPNALSLASGLFFFVLAAAQGFPVVRESFSGAFLMAVVWGMLWSMGVVGGGDHKLMIVVGAALGSTLVLPATIAVMIIGGVQAALWLAHARAMRPRSWRTLLKEIYIPYSVSIAAGSLLAPFGRLKGWW